VKAEDLHSLTVQTARREGLARHIAEATGLSIGAVRGRLKRAHGRMLLRNRFADVWPRVMRAVDKPARTRSRRTTKTAQPKNLKGSDTRTIHRVRQEFTTSCGVAVVAMFARVSHAEAMSVMFPNGGGFYGTWLKDVKAALRHFGVPYAPRWRRFKSWSEIPTTSLVKVRWTNADGSTGLHWVIFQRRDNGNWQVIDPDPPRGGTLRLSRAEARRYSGITYLSVEARRPS
jgi:hypothetical protein